MNDRSLDCDHLVVGSGPAGVAAALALANAGPRVTVVDGGHQLEADRRATVAVLSEQLPEDWSAADLASLSAAPVAGSGLAQKWTFASDFAYRDADQLAIADPGVGLRGSLARGGLSNVWGATLLPYTPREMKGWPITADDLAPHYRAVLEAVPHAARSDALEDLYPLHAKPEAALVPTATRRRILTRAARQRRRLANRGWTVGAARLAVRAGRPAPVAGCTYCRRCLDGCVYGHIWTSTSLLERLVATGGVRYEPGVVVDRVEDRGSAVVVSARGDGDGRQLVAGRVHLAAGVVGTTAVVQRSGLAPARVRLHDSQTVFLPFGLVGRGEPAPAEPAYTLAQVFLDQSGVEGGRPVQIQLYGWDASLPARARALRPRLARAVGPLIDRAMRQVLVGTCYLHSDDSPSILSELREGEPQPRLRAVPNDRTLPALRAFYRRAAVDLASLGLVPLPPLAHTARAGEGFHTGGSVPMRARPGPGESDRLGRPVGSTRVHVVDAACLPDVAAGAITLTVMANADRIATATVGLER